MPLKPCPLLFYSDAFIINCHRITLQDDDPLTAVGQRPAEPLLFATLCIEFTGNFVQFFDPFQVKTLARFSEFRFFIRQRLDPVVLIRLWIAGLFVIVLFG